MRMRTAHKAGMQHARQFDVVDISAMPAEQPLQLAPRKARADACRSDERLRDISDRLCSIRLRWHRQWHDSRCIGTCCPIWPRGFRSRLAEAARDQLVGCEQHAGRTEAALGGILAMKCRLQLGKARLAERPSMVSTACRRRLCGQHQATARRAAVDQHRASAASSMLAAEMRCRSAPDSWRRKSARCWRALTRRLERLAVEDGLDLELLVADNVGCGHAAVLFA